MPQFRLNFHALYQVLCRIFCKEFSKLISFLVDTLSESDFEAFLTILDTKDKKKLLISGARS